MSTLCRINWQVFLVKVENELFDFKAEFLIQTYSRICGRHMEHNVLAHAGLRQMVQHKLSDSGSLPSRPHSHKRNIGLVVADVRNQKGTANDKSFI